MPSAVASTIASKIFFSTAISGSTALFIAKAITTVLTVAITSVASSIVSSAFASRPKIPEFGTGAIAQRTRERTLSVRQSIAAHRVIYGETRVGGIVTFLHSTDDNERLHQLITLAGHEVNSIGQIYLDDVAVTVTSNTVSDTKYEDLVDVYTGVGSTSGDSALQSALQTNTSSKWTSDHKQTGRAKLYTRFKYDGDVFSGSLPNVTAVVQGKKVYDPRSTTTAYSNNSALCIRDYLTNSSYGLGEPASRINDTNFNAQANICDENVTLTAGGTEKRYTCNGTFNTDQTPSEVLAALLSSCAGKLTYQGGQWNLYVGAYATPSITFDESDADGGLQVTTQVSRRELFNGARGVYTEPDNLYQPTDFPVVKSSSALTEDQSEEIFKDFDFQFTTSSATAQRLAKIELQKIRQQITVLMPVSLKNGMRVQVGDNVYVTNSRMGWTNKVFNVEEWKFAQRGEGEELTLGVDLVLRETASTVFDWASSEESSVDAAPDTDLPNPFAVSAPTSLALSSGTSQLFVAGDGTVFSRIKATWTDSVDGFATHNIVEYKKSAETKWIPLPDVAIGVQQAFIAPVDDGVSYDVRVKAVNALKVSSTYLTVSSHIVTGKTQVPSNVTGFSAQQNGAVVTFKWDQVSDVDLAGYELRYSSQSAFSWGDAIALTKITKGTLVTNTGLPPGTWRVAVKAFDTSGNESATETTFDITLSNTNSIIYSVNEGPSWSGTLTNFILHQNTGRLVPDSNSLANATTDYSIFDNFVYNPKTTCTYEGAEIDLTFDATNVRVYATFTASLGPGETGSADPQSEIDYKTASGSYDGFEGWTVGTLNSVRYIKPRAKILTSTGVAYLEQFNPIVDAEERTESASSVTISASGGTAITFATRFNTAPNVSVQAVGTSALIGVPSSISATGFTAQVFNSSTGADVGGTINWTATGA